MINSEPVPVLSADFYWQVSLLVICVVVAVLIIIGIWTWATCK